MERLLLLELLIITSKLDNMFILVQNSRLLDELLSIQFCADLGLVGNRKSGLDIEETLPVTRSISNFLEFWVFSCNVPHPLASPEPQI